MAIMQEEIAKNPNLSLENEIGRMAVKPKKGGFNLVDTAPRPKVETPPPQPKVVASQPPKVENPAPQTKKEEKETRQSRRERRKARP
jgi:hypothetical protein